MKTSIAVVATLTLALFTQVAQAESQHKQDRELIADVVTQFDQAIKNKDKANFMSLFVKDNVSWIGVFDDDALAKRKKLLATLPEEKRPALTRMFASTPSEFIDMIIKAKTPNIETFENVRITTDGLIASVYFDYEFYRGEVKSNWGEEAWHLVKTMDGWKINSVIFSLTFNPEKK